MVDAPEVGEALPFAVEVLGAGAVSAELVVPMEPFDGAGTVVGVSGASGDVELTVVDTVLRAGLLDDWGTVTVDVAICAGVEVEETNGGAFWT